MTCKAHQPSLKSVDDHDPPSGGSDVIVDVSHKRVNLADALYAQGLVIVPIEPTREMIEAGFARFLQNGTASNIYRAMIEARPK